MISLFTKLRACRGWLAAAGLILALGLGPSALAAENSLGGHATLRGTITALNDNEMTLATVDEEHSLAIDADTRVHILDVADPGLGDLAVGDAALVHARATDGLPLARHILREPAGEPLRGRITALGENTLTMRGGRGPSIELRVDPATPLAARGEPVTTWGEQTSLQLGMPILAYATAVDARDVSQATALIAFRPAVARRVLRGNITDISVDGFALETDVRRVIDVRVGDDTRFFLQEGSGLDDLAVGQTLAVAGRARPVDGALDAARVSDRAAARADGVLGEITAVDGDAITVLTARGHEITLRVTAETQYHVGDAVGALVDFAPGNRVLALGRRADSDDADDTVFIAVRLARRAP